jgi:hypothetical protein
MRLGTLRVLQQLFFEFHDHHDHDLSRDYQIMADKIQAAIEAACDQITTDATEAACGVQAPQLDLLTRKKKKKS